MYSVENKSEESRAIQNNSEKHVPTAQFKDNRSLSAVEVGQNTAQLEKKENLTGLQPIKVDANIIQLKGGSSEKKRGSETINFHSYFKGVPSISEMLDKEIPCDVNEKFKSTLRKKEILYYSPLSGINWLFDSDYDAKRAAKEDSEKVRMADASLDYRVSKDCLVEGIDILGSGPEILDVYYTNDNKYIGYGYAVHKNDDNCKLAKNDSFIMHPVRHYHAIKQGMSIEKESIEKGSRRKYIKNDQKYSRVGEVEHYLVNPFK